MASRVKEDEKNERIIRNLLKLPENRRCINCNSLGPQYVCTNFSTFVCTNCSGIHREFTHRVKSVSMAKFTPQEVSALQGGGNASAREIYLKEWNSQQNSLPDGSNVEKLRTFIKHVYVDRRYTGERSLDKPPRAKMGESEDLNETRRVDAYQSGGRSPPYEDTYERRYSDRPSPGGRSPGYDQGSRQHSDYRKSPARAEVVTDWRRDDRFGNGRRSEGGTSDGGSRFEGRSPDHQRDKEMSGSPVVRPVRDILGENASPLRVIEPPKVSGSRSADDLVHPQRTESSTSLASSNGNSPEVKLETSLIDFDSVPESQVMATVSPVQQSPPSASTVQPTSSNGDNWANFDSIPVVKVSQAASHANPVESLLSELSIAPSASAGVPDNGALFTSGSSSPFPSSGSQVASFQPAFGSVAPPPAKINESALPPHGAAAATFAAAPMLSTGGQVSFGNAAAAGPWPTMQPQNPSFFPGSNGQSILQPVTLATSGSSVNQRINPLVASNSHGLSGVPPANVAPSAEHPAGEASSVVPTQSSGEVKSVGRKELPADLFTGSYSYLPNAVPGWHTGLQHGSGFSMHYNMPAPVPAFQPTSRSMNPFDVSNEPSAVQIPNFPSVGPLQGAMHNSPAPSGLLHASSIGTAVPHPSLMPTHAPPPYTSALRPNSYLGQQVSATFLPGQGVVGFGLEGSAFASLNPSQQQDGLHTAPAAPNNFTSVGGNPFG